LRRSLKMFFCECEKANALGFRATVTRHIVAITPTILLNLITCSHCNKVLSGIDSDRAERLAEKRAGLTDKI
jgi:hypothetical protein